MQIFELEVRYVPRREQAQMKGMWTRLAHIPKLWHFVKQLFCLLRLGYIELVASVSGVTIHKGPFAVFDLDHIAGQLRICSCKT